MKPKVKKRSPRLHVKIFLSLVFVAAFILGALWITTVLLFGRFYRHARMNELKRACLEVSYTVESAKSDRRAVIERLVAEEGINVRIVNITAFENAYVGGDGIVSASHDIGDYEVLRLYTLAKAGDGEVTEYYTFDSKKQVYYAPERERTDENGIGERFFKREPGFFITPSRYVDDFLYGRLLNVDGTEYLILADVRVTPLDSTVNVLRRALIGISAVTLIITLAVALFASYRIARPIKTIGDAALELAHGKYDTRFDGKGYREIEELSDTLGYTAGELGKAETFRKELLANVSHDLRTPLTMIAGYAEMMRDIPGENTPENAAVILEESKRLTAFVNDMLDLSKLETGLAETVMERLDLADLLCRIRRRYDELIGKDGYTVLLDAPEEIYIRGDENKLTQAFYNLIDNAVNHTGADKTVRIRLLPSPSAVRVEIADSGPGIPADELPYIWDRYYRGSSSHKRAVVGSGIGLSIVKAVFEKHNLRYGVESEQGAGSVFWVEFPPDEPETKK